jgi:hypothetical protein
MTSAVAERVQRDVPQSVPGAVTPMQMLQIAVQQGADLDKLEKLMGLQERWEANEAKKAFVAAMAAFKADPPSILKSKQVNIPGAAKFAHATLASVCDGVCAALSKHGLSHTWETSQQDGSITVTCVITHERGHSERTSLTARPDDSGRKNSIQQIASTVTYLERYTLMAATGLAAKDMDDDGRSAGRRDEGAEPDAEGKKRLEACASLNSLQEAWKALTPDQRKTLNGIKEACKARIQAADAEAAK